MTSKRRKKHKPEQIVAKLRDADAMLNAGKDLAAVLQALEISEATLHRWRAQYGGMKSEEAKRLKALEDENRRLKQLVADQALDIQMLKHLSEGNCFPEASGSDRASIEVRDLRAKGLQSNRPAAKQSAIQSEAAIRRGTAGEADASAGSCSSAVRLLKSRRAARPRRMASGAVPRVSTLAA